MAKYVFEYTVDHTVEVPAAVLETRLGDGEVVQTINVPAQTFHRKAGERVTFHNKKDASAFQRLNGDKVKLVLP